MIGPGGDRKLSINKATRIVLRWAIGGAVGMLVSWPVLLGLVLLLLVVIILSSAGGPAALAPPALAASNYSCTFAAPPPAPAFAAPNPTAAPAPAGDYAGTTLNAEQMKTAGTITAVTKQMNLTRRAAEIALAVAMQESTLDPEAVSGPWVGLFQQAPDPASGLYTQYDRTDPSRSNHHVPGTAGATSTRLRHRLPAELRTR